MSNSAPARNEPTVGTEPTGQEHVVFRVGALWLALPTTGVDEITELGTLTPLPRAPSHIPGLVSLRGRAVPLLDLGRFLDQSDSLRTSREVGDDYRLIVATRNDTQVGLIVDRVLGIRSVPEAPLSETRVAQGTLLREIATTEWDSPEGLIVALNLATLIDSSALHDT